MTRAQRQRLKEIDALLIQYGLAMQTLLRERAEIDLDSTRQFIDVLNTSVRQPKPTEENTPQ